MAEMTSRERVIRALNHQEPDRVPFDCSFVYESYLRIKDYLGLKTAREVLPGSPWLAVSNPLELLEALNIDLCYIGLNRAKDAPVFEYGMDHYTDEWGVEFNNVEQPSGLYYGFSNQVLGKASVEDLETYPWPDPYNPDLTEGLEEKAKRLYEETDFALVANSVTRSLNRHFICVVLSSC